MKQKNVVLEIEFIEIPNTVSRSVKRDLHKRMKYNLRHLLTEYTQESYKTRVKIK